MNYNYQQYPINYGNTQLDPTQVAAYAMAANNVSNTEAGLTDGLGLVSVFSLATGANKINKYAKNTGSTFTNVVKDSFKDVKSSASTLKTALKSGDKAALSEMSKFNQLGHEVFNLQASIPNAKKLAKMSEETRALYTEASSLLKQASKASTAAGKETLLNQAKTLLGKTSGKAAKKVATKAAEKTATTLGSKVLKCVKGNAAFAAIEGGIELFTNVVPTFQKLGAKSGMKQVGKSTVKVAASVGGFAAGAAVGAAIGSVIPVAGTAVGAVVGGLLSFVGGLFCSSAATKVAEKVVGKNELELAEEKEQEEMAKIAQQNEQVYAQAPAQQYVNPFMTQNVGLNSYMTQDNSDNLLMMPARGALQFTA